MSISISGVYLDPSTVLPEQAQIPTATGTTTTQSVDSIDYDVITLSSATKVQKLDKQGEPPEQIAQSLGISLSTVELDLGEEPTIDVSTGSGGASASGASSTSTSSSTASGAGSASSTHVSTWVSTVAAGNSGSTSDTAPAVSSDSDAAAAGSSTSSSKDASSTPAAEPVSAAPVAQVAATPIPRNPFA
jgi:hypothetical protein